MWYVPQVLWSIKGGWNLWIEACTQPYYACVCYFLGSLLTLAIAEINVVAEAPHWALPLLVLAYYVGMMLVIYPLGKLLYTVTAPGFAKPPAPTEDGDKAPLTGAPKQGGTE
jgi:hypothetical protein